MTFIHNPVLLDEVLEALSLKPGDRVLDATIGGGGHAEAILRLVVPTGSVVGIDRDATALAMVSQRFQRTNNSLVLIHDDFRQVVRSSHPELQAGFDGALIDLGCSSFQLDEPERGFSFAKEAELDMRMDRSRGPTAAELLAHASLDDILRWIREFGEERYWKRIAEAIITERSLKPITTTTQLAGIVVRAIPAHNRDRRIHPATRTFQAIRIAVNQELAGLDEAITAIMGFLHPGARMAVISFHSLEDRIVKTCFQREAKDCLCSSDILVCRCGHKRKGVIVTKKPVRPKAEETGMNPRARSARLRVFEIGGGTRDGDTARL